MTLRKSCQNCTKSKRKCTIQLPKCNRCFQKGLDCQYDLEPLNVPTIHDQQSEKSKPPTFSFNPLNCDSPGYCILKTLKMRIRTGSDIDPAICKPGHMDSLELLRFGFLSVPDQLALGKPSIFVHPKLQVHGHGHGDYDYFAGLRSNAANGSAGGVYEKFENLIQLDVKTMSIKEILSAIQALLVYMAMIILYSSHSQEQEETPEKEKFLNILNEWTQTLLMSMQPRESSSSSSPWQEWLFGESVRRTIFMSYALKLGLSSFKYGYCSNWLFIESLPFDGRAGLWMAESPQAWIAAARVKTGEEVGEQLCSVHEFAMSHMHDSGKFDFIGDSFLSLVLRSHNGA